MTTTEITKSGLRRSYFDLQERGMKPTVRELGRELGVSRQTAADLIKKHGLRPDPITLPMGDRVGIRFEARQEDWTEFERWRKRINASVPAGLDILVRGFAADEEAMIAKVSEANALAAVARETWHTVTEHKNSAPGEIHALVKAAAEALNLDMKRVWALVFRQAEIGKIFASYGEAA